MDGSPSFDDGFFERLRDLIAWRRDVRRFRDEPVAPELIDELIALACLSPSVGNSQPWRFVKVADPDRRRKVVRNFEASNRAALTDYEGERAKLYAGLKLAGLKEAPVHLAVFCDRETLRGHGLGQRTMPETVDYSVVAATQTLWLAARARGLGVGWVSILDPAAVTADLDVPDDWALIAYLCIGYPEEEHADPELVRHGWQDRAAIKDFVLDR